MKKKTRGLVLLAGCALILGLAACGDEDVKVVNKMPGGEETAADSGEDGNETGKDASSKEEKKDTPTGYIFEAETDGGKVSVWADMDMKTVLEGLGEADTYFEAASCAFEGLDKTYTYAHFQIETYPDGEIDRVSSIVFLDDLAETAEGVSIGMTKEEMESAYGTDYAADGDMAVYTKDGMHLSFLVKDGKIESVQYDSAVLDSAN